MKRALITGITGQDGSYLAELLLAKGYEVHGIVRRSCSFNTERIEPSTRIRTSANYRLRLHLRRSQRRSVAQSHPAHGRSPTRSTTSARRATCACQLRRARVHRRAVGLGTLRLLEAIRELGLDPRRASTRRRRARCSARRRRRRTRPRRSIPRSPTRAPRCSPTTVPELSRGLRHVRLRAASCSTTSRRGAANRSSRARSRARRRASSTAWTDKLYLGNLDAKRDWGFAGDYVEAMWTDAAAGQARRLRDRHRRVALGARAAARWRSATLGLDWKKYVEIDPRYFRPTEVDHLRGDAGEGAQGVRLEAQGDVPRSWCR